MSNTPKDGGPAFPVTNKTWTQHGTQSGVELIEIKTPVTEGGMTLRDWFAGQALGFIAMQPVGANNISYQATALDAYAYADAMLAERAKGQP
jgi:hypothetical protein